ncbi:unnamed protein product, partial [Ectocarpus sp. 4 AP-2014]
HPASVHPRCHNRSTGEQLVWNIAGSYGVQAISPVSRSTRDSSTRRSSSPTIPPQLSSKTPLPLLLAFNRSRRLATPLPACSSRLGCAGGDDGGDASGRVLLLSPRGCGDSEDISGDAGGRGHVDGRAEVADHGGDAAVVLLLPPPPSSVGVSPSRSSLWAAAGVEAIVLPLQVLPPSLHVERFPPALPNLAARFRTLMPIFRRSLPL